MSKKPECSGIRCVMSRNFKAEDCKLFEECEYYTPSLPTADIRGMEAVIDMAVKQFCIQESDREKLRILFNAYVVEYMRVFCVI